MHKQNHSHQPDEQKVRIDKWLWAARFYKTRSLAQQAVEGGKVHYEGQRVKPSKEVIIGGCVEARVGHDTREVIIKAISQRRGPAKEAQQLYEETEESLQLRERNAELRRAARAAAPETANKPNKQQRRKLKQLKDWPH